MYQTKHHLSNPELEKHKVDDVVTVDKKRDNNNDIQRSEEEDNEQQLQSTATTNTVFCQTTEQTILDLEYRRAQTRRY